MSTAKEPAFPCEVYHREDGTLVGVQTGSKQGITTGLTKRELFAAIAMQGCASIVVYDTEVTEDAVAKTCVALADALLKELGAQ